MQWGLPQAGAVVGEKYVITRLLGRGGMGAVYVVEHRFTGKRLALKCLLPEHREHPEFMERFLREAQAAGRIQHRNVVDVFDVGQDGDLVYIVMELLDGKPLSDLLHEGKLTLEETLQILLRAMDGVAAAHQVGIVHRDLKPDNIFVCVGQSGRIDDPRVLDFGISKLEDDASKPLTKSGVMMGTPYYMAFEQINSQRDLDQRVDVYAMGVILYEAMAGQPPYVAESVGALAIRMMSAPPTPLSQLRPELPEGLTEVVMRSIARDREQRYPTMQALIEALRPFVSDSASMLLPQGQGTPLGVSVRTSQAVDATLPAMSSATPTPLKSSARLKLRVAEDQAERTPSIAGSTRTLLWVAGVALLLILGGTGLILALRDPAPDSDVKAEPLAPSEPTKRAPRPPKAKAPSESPAPREAVPSAPEEATAQESADGQPPADDKAGSSRTPRGKKAAKAARGRENKAAAASAPAASAPAASAPAASAPAASTPPATPASAPTVPVQAPSAPAEATPEPVAEPPTSEPVEPTSEQAPEPTSPAEAPAAVE